MMSLIRFYVTALLLLPVSSHAALAITCHCFTDRSYDASRPAHADPYFLATTQNSFFSTFFSVDKKTVVMKKQGGVSSDDLWVAYWVASKSGKSGDALLSLRGKAVSWHEIIVPMGLPAQSIGKQFAADVSSGASTERLAQVIVDGVLAQYGVLGEHDVVSLRNEWASNQEIILAALLAKKNTRSALQIYRDVKKGTKSWGALLHEATIKPAAMQAEFAALLKLK